jgi:hypothetical protein
MKKTVSVFIGSFVVLQLMTALAALSAIGAELTREQIDYAEKVHRDRKKSLGGELEFHGKVVDFDGNPVAGAKVNLDVMFVPSTPLDQQEFRQVESVTDAEGCFLLKEEGFSLSVKNILKDGYTYRFNYSKDFSFSFKKGKEREGRGEHKDQPFTFRIRKLAPPAFVVLHNMTFGLKPGKPAMFDMIKRQWVRDEATIMAMQYSSVDRDWHTDIRLSVDGEPEKLHLVIEAPDADSGFVVEKHEFFEQMTEAPEHGYRQRLEIPVKSEWSPIMLYVKCQAGLFYGKVYMEFSESKSGVVAVNATSFTNLSKERDLEYIPAIESQYDEEVYGKHSRKSVRRADLLSGQPIEMPKGSEIAR